MTYEYGSDSKRLELPDPYRLENRLPWLCGALLVGAGVVSLLWARNAMQESALRLAAAPIVAGLLLLGAGLAAAAPRLRFFFGRGRPASLAPEIAPSAIGGSPAAGLINDIVRQGGLTCPEPQGAIVGLLYHWMPTLITAPREVQALARRYAFNLAAIAATLVSFLFSWFLFGNEATRPWIAILYFAFGLVFLLRPVLTALVLVAIGMSLVFVRHFDVAAPWQANRHSLAGDSAILAFIAAFCLQAASRLWGRFNLESILTWVETMGNYQTSRIGAGNNFSSRVNTENNVMCTEAMTLCIWRAHIESVVFGKNDARQITAMFTTEQEARALAAELMQFARGQRSMLVAPFSGEDERRMAALGAGERAMLASSGGEPASAAHLYREFQTTAALVSAGIAPPAAPRLRYCTACGTEAPAGARFCANCATPLPG
jgi:hypothetical protein